MMDVSKERLKKYKMEGDAALKAQGDPNLAKARSQKSSSVFSQAVFNSAEAILEFMQNKTSALEEWLIARTQFTQEDKMKYMKRVEQVKAKRQEYEANKKELTKQFANIEKKISELEKRHATLKSENQDYRKKLSDPLAREHDEAEAKLLQEELQQMQEDIAQGHRDKLEWSKKLYPKEHQLHMERHKISLLQVESGELKVLLEDVHHHADVESRATIFS